MLKKINITDITPADYNPRKMASGEYEKLSRNINEFGLVSPIIINLKNNHIIGGHQRYDVLLNEYMVTHKYSELNLLELGDIGWVFPDGELDIEDENFEKALNISLNKISGEWDNQKLNELFVDFELDGFDISLTGFDDDELLSFEFKKGLDEEEFEFKEGQGDIPEYIEKPSDDEEELMEDEEYLSDEELDNKVVRDMRISSVHIEVTDEEIEKLNALFKKYVVENKVPIGFPRYLIEEVK